jgi:hypothetical protein
MSTLISLAAVAAVAMGATAGSAMAATAGEIVSGTTLGTLALTGSFATFTTGFEPGGTATATGLLTATDTNGSATLTVGDSGTGVGHMIKATGSTCTGSDAQLANALTTNVTGTGFTSAGAKAIPIASSPVTVATAAAPIALDLLLTTYTQVIPGSEVMLTGCVYSLTATYTLQ